MNAITQWHNVPTEELLKLISDVISLHPETHGDVSALLIELGYRLEILMDTPWEEIE